jgi:hypothetical protein
VSNVRVLAAWHGVSIKRVDAILPYSNSGNRRQIGNGRGNGNGGWIDNGNGDGNGGRINNGNGDGNRIVLCSSSLVDQYY